MRAAEQGSGLGRLRRRVGPLLDDVRPAGRRRCRGELHLPGSATRARCEDRLLGDEPEAARGSSGKPDGPGSDRRLGRPRLLPRRRLVGLCDTVDRAQRDVGVEPRGALVADEHAVPRQRAPLRPPAERARRAPVPAPEQPPVHGRRSRRLVASSGALHELRARDLFLRSADLPPGPGNGLADAPELLPPGRHRPDLDRDPAVEDRHLPRLPHEPGPGRPRAPQAGERVVRHDQVAGASGQAGQPRDSSGDGLVLGLGRVGRDGSRSRQARCRLRLPLDARPQPLRRAEDGGAQVRHVLDRRPADPARRVAVHDAVGPARQLSAFERRARDGRPRDRVHVALRPARPQERGAGQAEGPEGRRAGDHPLPLRRKRRCLPRRACASRRLDRRSRAV